MRKLRNLFAAASTRRDTALDAGVAVDSDRAQLIAEAERHAAAGRYGESLALIGRALIAAPDDPDLLYARASTLNAWGRAQEAREGFMRAHAAGLRSTALYINLGWAWHGTGHVAEAEAWMRKATALEPGAWAAHFGLAAVLQAQKRIDEAVAAHERTLELYPDEFHTLVRLGQCLLERSGPAVAETQFRKALAVDTAQPAAWNNLGISLRLQRRHPEALMAFEQADRLEPEDSANRSSFVNLAVEHVILGRLQHALEICERNLARSPSIEGHGAYADALLIAGRLLEAWGHYEFRWLAAPLLATRSRSNRPVWDGQDLRGKTILLRVEQGFGDTIQFLRYAPYVKALGATVLLLRFDDVARAFRGIDRLVEPTDSLELDYYINLVSLPRIFGTDVESIPGGVPYLEAEPERMARWVGRLGGGGGLRVGVSWAGSRAHGRDRERSIALQMLLPLLQVDGVRFFSLQKGAGAAEAEALAGDPRFVDLGPELEDFSDTAAVISQLDLVLCVDTAVGHLAGALGKPVWLMVQKDADWRWMMEREDSPWYPTLRLFRQSRHGDWSDVIERVRAALEQRLRDGSGEGTPRAATLAPSPPRPRPMALARLSPGHKPGFSAVAETRVGILQYFPEQPIVGDSIDWYGEYLQPQLNLLAQLLKPGATVLEADAGVGVHALFLAAAIGPTGHLFLYEPRPLLQRVLRQNLGANRVANVTLMRRGLGRPQAPVATEGAGSAAAAKIAVTDTVDELQLAQLHLLKLNDAEHALEVLAGATDTLWRLRPLLFMAARDEAALAALVARAKDFSYRCWRLQTAVFDRGNFNCREEDLFAGRQALALLAIPEELELDIALEGCVEMR